MKLEKLLDKIDYTLLKGNMDIEVKDIAYDSRNVDEGYAFIGHRAYRYQTDFFETG